MCGSDRLVKNSPAVVFCKINLSWPSAQHHKHDKRSAYVVPKVRRGPRALARGHRGDGAHWCRVSRAIEHLKLTQ